MTPLLKVILLCAVLVGSTVATTTTYTTNSRSAYFDSYNCSSCGCTEIYVDAYEYSNDPSSSNPTYYLYVSVYQYDWCVWTWSWDGYYSTAPLAGLSISPSGRTAQLVAGGLTSVGGQPLALSLSWVNPSSDGGCNCRSSSSAGPYKYKSVGHSSSATDTVTGSVQLGTTTYNVTGTTGYLYGSGDKTVVITHP